MQKRTKELLDQIANQFAGFPFGRAAGIRIFTGDATTIESALETVLYNLESLHDTISGSQREHEKLEDAYRNLNGDVAAFRRVLGIDAIVDAVAKAATEATAELKADVEETALDRLRPRVVLELQALGRTHKINAIKRTRELTGAGLKEAKEFIDMLVK